MYIVSACLAGINCRYDGSNNKNELIYNLVKQGKAIPVCPEVLGGMGIPRIPSEINIDKNGNKKVVNKYCENVTKFYLNGAKKTLQIAKAVNACQAIFKSRSPSCGSGLIYDGTFSEELVEGKGITTDLLEKYGIEVFTEKNINKIKHI